MEPDPILLKFVKQAEPNFFSFKITLSACPEIMKREKNFGGVEREIFLTLPRRCRQDKERIRMKRILPKM